MRENVESFATTRRKSWEKSEFWGHISNSECKIWGISHLYFWMQNLGLQQKCQKEILGQAPPPPNTEVLPLGLGDCKGNKQNHSRFMSVTILAELRVVFLSN